MSIALSMRGSSVLIISLIPSICILSIVRVVAIKRLNLSLDLTYDSVSNNIYTSLEPTLGVINACLPLLRPVFSKLSGNMMTIRYKRRSNGGILRENRGSKEPPVEPFNEPKSRKFHLSPDEIYPLTDLTATQSHCTGPDLELSSNDDANSLQEGLESPSDDEI